MLDLTQIFSNLIPENFFYYLKSIGILLLIIIWIFSVSYVMKDSLKRIKDTLTKTLLIILTIISGPVGLLIHLILRPSQTLSESTQAKLEKIILTKEFQNNFCPFCAGIIEKDYIFCPSCAKQITKHCNNCEKIVKKEFSVCPYCGNKE